MTSRGVVLSVRFSWDSLIVLSLEVTYISSRITIPKSKWPSSMTNYWFTFSLNLKFSMFRAGTFGAVFEYGCETRISKHSIIGASLSMGVPSGVSLKLRF